MKRIFSSAAVLIVLAMTWSCNKFLDVKPQGVISDVTLSTPENIDKVVIAAYAMLGNDHYTVPNQLWPQGDLRAGDAYKGGDGPADIAVFSAMELFSTLKPDMSAYAPSTLGDLNNKKWERGYIAVSRINNALRRLNDIDETVYPLKNQRIAEMKFLRGHFFFELKILYKYMPWFDENAGAADIEAIGNREFTNEQLWEKIANDFISAADGLPVDQTDKGRPHKFTAKAYLAKTRLYQAYEQNDQHVVTTINPERLNQVIALVDEVIVSAKFSLAPDFAQPFLWENENGPESVWAIQRSHDDGTTTGNVDFSSMLNNPMSSQFGCCGFHVPSQNLVNAFKTDENGLPLLDSYNQADLNLATNTIDPRLDHTVGQPGKPWKYEPTIMYDISWSRQPGIYGPFASLKENVSPNCTCFERLTPFMSSSKNTILIRYSDVLLWKAEALIELGRQGEALPIINEIRSRAKNSVQLLKDINGVALSNYKVEPYSGGWDQDFARKALRFERRLELALEGHRFFDLVRWGVANDAVSAYLSIEKSKREYLSQAMFEKGKNEFMPIPQQQINLSKGLYKQNPGY